MMKMKVTKVKVAVFCLALLSAVILTAPTSRAEFKVWAPINPQFIGGNPLNGPWMLRKAELTNEHDPAFDDDPSDNPGNPGNPAPDIGPVMDRFLDSLDRILGNSARSVERAISTPINLQLTGGTGNTSVFTPPAGR